MKNGKLQHCKLIQKKGEEVGKFKVTIVGDAGDANYVTDTELFTKEHMEEFALEGLRDLREKASLPHELSHYDNEYDLPIPSNFHDGYCHTLVSVTVEFLGEEGKVWTLEY